MRWAPLLVLTGALAFLVAFYVLYTDVPKTDPMAMIDGFFSPHSWWPLVVALGAATIAMGLVFAVWVIVLGGAVLLLGIVGWLFEYYRGEFAR